MDGEVGLSILSWYLHERVAYRRVPADRMHPKILQAFEEEAQMVVERKKMLHRDHTMEFLIP